MTRVLRGILLLWLGLSGCSQDIGWVSPPPIEGARSVVYFAEAASLSYAFAVDLEPGLVTRLPVEPTDDLVLYSVSYDRSLAELNLVAGRLEDDPAGTVLPPGTVMSTRYDGAFDAWKDSAPSPKLASFRGGPRACKELVQVWERELLDINGGVAARVAADRIVLYQLSQPALVGYVVTSTGVTPKTWNIPVATLNPAWFMRGDQIWLGGVHGELWTGPPTGPFVLTGTVPGGRPSPPAVEQELQVLGLDGDPEGAEMFAVKVRVFMRFDGTRWQELLTADPTASSRQVSTVIWVEPGHAIAGLTDDHVIHHWDAEAGLSTEAFNFLGAELHNVPEMGPVAVGADGRLHGYRDGVWSPMLNEEAVQPTDFLVPLDGGGFLLADREGLAQQVLADERLCPAFRLAPEGVSTVAGLEGHIFTVGEPPSRMARMFRLD